MTDIAELIKEVQELFDEGWCVCRSSHLPGDMLAALIKLDQENQALATTLEARIEPVGLYPEDMLTWEGTLFRRQVSPWVKVPDDQF